ncbi:hypothetical protein V7S43_007990 [Phytophthora oleae]|uniref:mitogen-activated protein kinase kinase n=1 Tax=Phytophthora oleae TaxID=2107226 RepID=A0ABD3FKW6_9STRA
MLYMYELGYLYEQGLYFCTTFFCSCTDRFMYEPALDACPSYTFGFNLVFTKSLLKICNLSRRFKCNDYQCSFLRLARVMMKATADEEYEAKPLVYMSGVTKKAEAKASSIPSQFGTPTDERRAASHPDAKASSFVRVDSGMSESKLKQPEVKILDRHRPTVEESDRSIRAESKMDLSAESSLRTARSVQSLANDMRRIRSMRTDPEEAVGDEGRKPKVAEKKKSSEGRLAPGGRPRPAQIKLEIADLDVNVACPPDQGVPNRQATRSPKLSGPSGFGRPGTSTSPASSAGKKGIHRNFVQGLGSDFQLDLHTGSTDRLEKSYDLSASGTFDAVGFQIKQTGLIRSPDRGTGGPSSTQSDRRQQPSNTKKHLVKLGVLGRGASGVVHKALHVPSLMLVAVKVIPVFEHEKRHQLIAELKSLYNNLSALPDAETSETTRQSVACPELVCLYDAYMNPNEGNVSIVVEYMDGGSLQDIVDTGGCTSEVVLANISFRVLKGLAFLHSTHQLHRDIKPSNLLINHFGDVKVSDFGIVREMENSMAKATTFVGTLTYMSPERIASEEYSYKSDVWSFGLSIMTCALGKFPYSSRGGYWELLHMIRNEPPPRLPEGEFSDLFCDFLDKCLKKDQTERWSVKQLLKHEFIQRHCSDQAATPSPGSRRTTDEEESKSVEDESKEQAEVDEIVQKVVEHYFKDARELVKEHGYTLEDIAAWIQLLPAMQKVKLSRFAEQIGANRSLVCAKFQEAMNDLLSDIEDTYFDAKQSK